MYVCMYVCMYVGMYVLCTYVLCIGIGIGPIGMHASYTALNAYVHLKWDPCKGRELHLTHPVDRQCVGDAQGVEALLAANPSLPRAAPRLGLWSFRRAVDQLCPERLMRLRLSEPWSSSWAFVFGAVKAEGLCGLLAVMYNHFPLMWGCGLKGVEFQDVKVFYVGARI